MPHQSAFTLIEVLIVLLIIFLLGVIAVPGLRAVMLRAEDDAVRGSLMRMIDTASSEAELQHKTVTLCKSADLIHCGGSWSDGQIIFIDAYHDDVVHEASQIIAVNQMQKSRGILQARFYPRYRQAVHFNFMMSELNDNGSFWYCRAHAEQPSWALTINRAGTLNISMPDANGEIKDAHGEVFKC